MFEKAIEIIMAEPTELHYPAYFADLLRKADVPDENVGECSETPNSSDLISRQAAIDALAVGKEALNRVLDEMDIVGTDREKYSWGLGLIESAIKDIEQLPSAQPERKTGKWIYNSPVTMKCNQCGLVIKDWDWHRFKYCPNCCSDMRGGRE